MHVTFLVDFVISLDTQSVHRVIRDYAKLIFVRNFLPYLSSQFAGMIILLYLYTAKRKSLGLH